MFITILPLLVAQSNDTLSEIPENRFGPFGNLLNIPFQLLTSIISSLSNITGTVGTSVANIGDSLGGATFNLLGQAGNAVGGIGTNAGAILGGGLSALLGTVNSTAGAFQNLVAALEQAKLRSTQILANVIQNITRFLSGALVVTTQAVNATVTGATMGTVPNTTVAQINSTLQTIANQTQTLSNTVIQLTSPGVTLTVGALQNIGQQVQNITQQIANLSALLAAPLANTMAGINFNNTVAAFSQLVTITIANLQQAAANLIASG